MQITICSHRPPPNAESLPKGLVSSPANNGDLCLLRLHERTIAAPLKAHNPCSAGLDHPTQSEVVLKEGENSAKAPTGVWGPLPKEMVGLIPGKSSLSIKGIPVIPGESLTVTTQMKLSS